MLKKKKLLACLMIIVVLGTSMFSLATVNASNPLKVACIGDSITEGVGSSNEGYFSYPAYLGRLLGSNYTVNNYGLGGRDMLKKGDQPYWNESAFTNSQSWLPNIVIIQLGTNDCKTNNWQYKSDFLSNYEEMINIYKNLSSHPTVYVCLPTTIYSGSSISNTVLVNECIPLIRQAAADTNCPVIDNNSTTTNMNQLFPDNLHPNDVGYAVLSNIIYSGLTSTTPAYNVSKYYSIVNRNSGKVSDIQYGSTADGAQLIQWPSTWVNNQQWQIINLGGGNYMISSRNSGKVVGVNGGSTDNGANVIQWTSNGHNDQQWQIVSAGNGYFKLICRNSGKAVGVLNASTADAAQLIQWEDNGNYDQQWQITQIP